MTEMIKINEDALQDVSGGVKWGEKYCVVGRWAAVFAGPGQGYDEKKFYIEVMRWYSPVKQGTTKMIRPPFCRCCIR